MSEATGNDIPQPGPTSPGRSLPVLLRDARKHLVARSIFSRTAVVVPMLVIFLLVAMLLDYWVILPDLARLFLLVVFACGAAYGVYWAAIQPYQQAPDDEAAALYLERRLGGLSNKLICSVQLSRSADTAGNPMIQRLLREAESLAGKADLSAAFPREENTKSYVSLGLAVLLLVIFFIVGGAAATALFGRFFMMNYPIPRDTYIVEGMGDITVPQGRSVPVRFQVEGDTPAAGELLVETATGASWVPLNREEGGVYTGLINEAAEDMVLRAYINDARSESSRVTVVPAAEIERLVAKVSYPAYTDRDFKLVEGGVIPVMVGGAVQLDGFSTEPLKAASLSPVGAAEDLPMEIDPQNPKHFSLSLPVNGDMPESFVLKLKDHLGFDYEKPMVYRLRKEKDSAPLLRVREPIGRSATSTTTAYLPVAYEARDDFGLDNLRLRLLRGEEALIDREIPAGATSEKGREVIQLGELPLSVGDELTLHLSASDRQPNTDAGTTSATPVTIKIVSRAEKRAELLGRAADTISRLERVADEQDHASSGLQRMIQPDFIDEEEDQQ